MREDDIVWPAELKIGDLLFWGSTCSSFYMLLYIDKEPQGAPYIDEMCLYFIDVKKKQVYRHFIELDNHLAYCVLVNKNS